MVSIMKERDKKFVLDFGRRLFIKLSLTASRRLVKFKNEDSCVKIIKPIDLFSWKEIRYVQLSLIIQPLDIQSSVFFKFSSSPKFCKVLLKSFMVKAPVI